MKTHYDYGLMKRLMLVIIGAVLLVLSRQSHHLVFAQQGDTQVEVTTEPTETATVELSPEMEPTEEATAGPPQQPVVEPLPILSEKVPEVSGNAEEVPDTGGPLPFEAVQDLEPPVQPDGITEDTVDIRLLTFVAGRYMSSDTEADLNRDGTVNLLDLTLVAKYYGQPYLNTENAVANEVEGAEPAEEFTQLQAQSADVTAQAYRRITFRISIFEAQATKRFDDNSPADLYATIGDGRRTMKQFEDIPNQDFIRPNWIYSETGNAAFSRNSGWRTVIKLYDADSGCSGIWPFRKCNKDDFVDVGGADFWILPFYNGSTGCAFLLNQPGTFPFNGSRLPNGNCIIIRDQSGSGGRIAYTIEIQYN